MAALRPWFVLLQLQEAPAVVVDQKGRPCATANVVMTEVAAVELGYMEVAVDSSGLLVAGLLGHRGFELVLAHVAAVAVWHCAPVWVPVHY
jgi:hypothetical protein